MTRGTLSYLGFVALIVVFCSADVVLAQPGRGRGGWGGTSALQLLSSEKVQKELEMVDDQMEIVEQLQQEQRESMRDMFSGMRERFRDMGEDERRSAMEEIREKMTESNNEYQDRVYEELLPHQVDRLKQLMQQASSRRSGGITGGQVSEGLVEELGITEEQIEKMKKKADEVKGKLEKKIAQLRSQAEDEILSVLDTAQREKYRKLMGESFEFDQNQGRRRGGGGQRRERDRNRESEPEQEDSKKSDF